MRVLVLSDFGTGNSSNISLTGSLSCSFSQCSTIQWIWTSTTASITSLSNLRVIVDFNIWAPSTCDLIKPVYCTLLYCGPIWLPKMSPSVWQYNRLLLVQTRGSPLAVREPLCCSSQTDHHFWWFHLLYPQSVVLASRYISPRHVCSSATIVLHNSIMSAPSTTSYYPFDSEAPRIFRNTQTNNYLNGKWLKQSHDINIISCLLTH